MISRSKRGAVIAAALVVMAIGGWGAASAAPSPEPVETLMPVGTPVPAVSPAALATPAPIAPLVATAAPNSASNVPAATNAPKPPPPATAAPKALTPAKAVATAAPTCPPPVPPSKSAPLHVRAPAEYFDLVVADSQTTREYGLMCVRSLAPHAGMIFVFGDGDYNRDFWMKNTLIPLDMIFVAKNGYVNNVRADVPATTVETPDEKIPHRAGTGAYVIELAAGEAARAGIKPDVKLTLRGLRAERE